MEHNRLKPTRYSYFSFTDFELDHSHFMLIYRVYFQINLYNVITYIDTSGGVSSIWEIISAKISA